jgi:hypothetical protein
MNSKCGLNGRKANEISNLPDKQLTPPGVLLLRSIPNGMCCLRAFLGAVEPGVCDTLVRFYCLYMSIFSSIEVTRECR